MHRRAALLPLLSLAGACAGYAVGAIFLSGAGPAEAGVVAFLSHPAAALLGALRGGDPESGSFAGRQAEAFLMTCACIGAVIGALSHLRLSSRRPNRATQE